jgi:hypothetical protein
VSERGSATVELALLVPLIILIMAMIVEVALAGRLQIEVVAAAREGARVAATTPDPAAALDAAVSILGPRGHDARINVHRPHVVGGEASVTVSLEHRVSIPVLDWISVPLSATSVMRVEN